MEDKDLVTLCRKIYSTHREAIDLIVEYGMVSKFSEVVNAVLEKEGSFEVLYSSPSSVWFLPDTWSRVLPENGAVWRNLKRPVSVACWLYRHPDKIQIVFEVSRMRVQEDRLACVRALQKAGFVLRKDAFREDATYSRFFSETRKVRDFDDEDQIRDALNALLAEAKEQFPKAAAAFADVFGNK